MPTADQAICYLNWLDCSFSYYCRCLCWYAGYFCTGTVRGWSSPGIPSMKRATRNNVPMTDNDYTWICYYDLIILQFIFKKRRMISYSLMRMQRPYRLCAPYLALCWSVGQCSASAAKWPSFASVSRFVSASSLWDSRSLLTTRHNSTSGAFSLDWWTVQPLPPHKST